MHSALLLIFIVCVYVILHSYLFYPLFLAVFTPRRKQIAKLYTRAEDLPAVALLMAAYNEEKVINEKIKSVMESDYPASKITFFIGSDASTDATDSIVKNWAQNYPAIKLVSFAGRTGKSGIINKLAEQAQDGIFILTDANVVFKKDTLFNLVRHFKDKKVSQVCANIIKVSDSDKGIAMQEKAYIAFENEIKYNESLRWNVVMGAEGGCYAIRKQNFSPVPPKFYMDDFYITLNVVEQGGQILFDREAVCLEDVSTQSQEEFKRKVRISIGNFQNLFRYKKLLLPFWKGSAFAFWSHKVFRWFTPFLLLSCFVISFALMFHYKVFIILFILQAMGFLMPLFDRLLNINFKYLKYISHFYLMNLALLKGFIEFVKGVESNVWQPTKREVN